MIKNDNLEEMIEGLVFDYVPFLIHVEAQEKACLPNSEFTPTMWIECFMTEWEQLKNNNPRIKQLDLGRKIQDLYNLVSNFCDKQNHLWGKDRLILNNADWYKIRIQGKSILEHTKLLTNQS